MNRFASNFILSLFVLVLMGVYGFTKQDTVSSYYLSRVNSSTAMKQGSGLQPVNQVVLPGGKQIEVLIAQDPESRRLGLSILDHLDDGHGMLFKFDEAGPQSIWMKDMKFPIDIVWLDGDGRVVEIVRNAPVPAEGDTNLPVYTNQIPAKYVLELPAGTTDTVSLQIGSSVQI